MSCSDTFLSKLPNDWQVTTAETALEKIIDYRGKTPEKSTSGILTLSAKSVKNGYIDYSNAYFISPKTYKSFMVRGFPKVGDILITTEAPLGIIAKLDRNDIAVAQRLLTLRGKKDYLDNNYLMYFLMSDLGQQQLKSKSTGTTVTGIKQAEFRKIYIIIPPYSEQKAIAATLSCLDDMIELNNKTNKILEEMAQAIFKRWFVDFEFPDENGQPYKSSGGEMEESELGPIPKDWRIGVCNEFIDRIISGDWGKDQNQGSFTEKVICIRGADIPDIAKGGKGKAPYRFIPKKNLEVKELKSDEIIVEISGGSPTQSTGRCALISNHLINAYEVPLVCTNFCRAVQLKKYEYALYVYNYWQYLYEKDVFFQYENGTTGIKNLDFNGFLSGEKIVIPSQAIMIDFSKIVEVCIKCICQNASEIITLSILRDALLPKLMSGEIRVPYEKEEA